MKKLLLSIILSFPIFGWCDVSLPESTPEMRKETYILCNPAVADLISDYEKLPIAKEKSHYNDVWQAIYYECYVEAKVRLRELEIDSDENELHIKLIQLLIAVKTNDKQMQDCVIANIENDLYQKYMKG
jgi:hypothetical protein